MQIVLQLYRKEKASSVGLINRDIFESYWQLYEKLVSDSTPSKEEIFAHDV